MQKFEFLQQPLLGELAMSWREREKKEREKQAGAELCQAQVKLGYFGLIESLI